MCIGTIGIYGRCKQCDDLGHNEYLKEVIARFTKGTHENTPLAYHGLGGLIEIAYRRKKENNLLRLSHLNDLKKLVGREGTIDTQKQLLLAISSQHIPHINHVLHVGFCRGNGIHKMLEMVKKAAEGTYHPRGFDEEEDLQVLLFLRLGSARVADVAHHIFGTPAVSTIWRHTIIPQILASPSFPTTNEIESNIAASFKVISDLLGALTQKMLHAVIMFDEISVEKCPRWDDKTNKVLGLCCKHGQGTSLEFNSEDDLQTI